VRALVALLTLPIVLTGVALAAPVAFVGAGDGARELLLPLDDGGRFRYTYEQSIYGVPVVEELVRTGELIRIERVRSPDIRSVEYFRWDGTIRRAQDAYVQDAPENGVRELVIRVTPAGQQRLVTRARTVPLRETFGDTVVHVRPVVLPLLSTVLP